MEEKQKQLKQQQQQQQQISPKSISVVQLGAKRPVSQKDEDVRMQKLSRKRIKKEYNRDQEAIL
jgi:hypothetical protein